ncbi:unnamed protein product [Prorocentrum cordatum]|uniref:Uncharacterized protein n=1 Tax=Prorocentrum cordatum TaxID=2364126 RepID=A0ABN9X0R3_9DINO|nr:unnamed protein product [Polarella glacialis]
MHETTRRGRRSLRERAARARTPGCMHRQALRVKKGTAPSRLGHQRVYLKGCVCACLSLLGTSGPLLGQAVPCQACRRRRAAPVQLSPPPLAEAGGAAGTGGACLPEPDFMLEPAGAMPQTSTAGRTPRKDRGDARSLCGRTAPPARRGNSRSWRKCRSRQVATPHRSQPAGIQPTRRNSWTRRR